MTQLDIMNHQTPDTADPCQSCMNNYVVEDGYNTLYLSTILVALFHTPSVIDRCLLFENNSQKLNGILLQKIIETNFVNMFRHNISITSKLLNQIRVCSHVSGWKNTKNIDELLQESDPISFLIFLLQTIEFYPIEISKCPRENYSISRSFGSTGTFTPKRDTDIEKTHCVQLKTIKSSIQESYNEWIYTNDIMNIPQFVMFQITNLTDTINIDKKIWLFPKNHEYHMIRWNFYSMICYDGTTYHTIINKDNKPYLFYQNSLPCIKKVDEVFKNKYEKIYIIYTKEPLI
jgi:hypothetical protein